MNDNEIDKVLRDFGMFPNPDARACMRSMAATALDKQAAEMIAENDMCNTCTVHDAARHLQGVAVEYRKQAEGEA